MLQLGQENKVEEAMRAQEKALFEMPDSVQQLFFDRIDEVTAQKQRLARPEEDEDYNNAF